MFKRARKTSDIITKEIFLLMFAFLFSVSILCSLLTLAQFNIAITPHVEQKLDHVLSTIKRDLERAISYGIELQQIPKLDHYLEQFVDEHREFKNIDLLMSHDLVTTQHDSDGGNNNRSSQNDRKDTSIIEYGLELATSVALLMRDVIGQDSHGVVLTKDIVKDGIPIARISASIKDNFIRDELLNIIFDTFITFFVVLLVCLEVVAVFSFVQITQPMAYMETVISERLRGHFGSLEQLKFGSQGIISQILKQMNEQHYQLKMRLNKALESAQLYSKATLERLKHFQLIHKLEQPITLNRASAIDVRIPLFIFSFGEELQKSFLPLFVAEYYTAEDWFSKEIMMGLPITAFMLAIVVITPFAGVFIDRYGCRRLFLSAIIPAFVGYIICFFAQSGNDIVIGRTISAIGYAIIIVSCQVYMYSATPQEQRNQGMATFIGVLMAATMGGTVVGAIFSEWLGFKNVFLLAAAFCSLAGGLGFFMLDKSISTVEKSGEPSLPEKGRAASTFMVFRAPKMLLLILFCAMPAKIILTGFFYFFIPVYLLSLDVEQSSIGRIMMSYSLFVILFSPAIVPIMKLFNNNIQVSIIFTILSGVVLCFFSFADSVFIVFLIVATLGISHAFLKTPIILAVVEAAQSELQMSKTKAMSLLRTSERIGSAMGPLLVSFALLYFDELFVVPMLGAWVILMGLMFSLYLYFLHKTAVQ